MLFLFLSLLSLPVFFHEFTGEGEFKTVGCLEAAGGYFAVLSARESWQSSPRTNLFYLDYQGTSTLSYYLGGFLEPLEVCQFAGKKTIVCRDRTSDSTVLIQVGGANSVPAVFPEEFLGGVFMEPMAGGITLAGNDLPGDGEVRTAFLDDQLTVLSDQLYPECVMDVADVSYIDGETCVLGSSGQSGWQSDIVLFFPSSLEQYHYQPQTGRFTPVCILPLEDGCMVAANAMTDQNGMVGEIFVMRLDGNMTVQWTAWLGGESWVNAASAAATGEGMAVAGWTNDLPFSETDRSDLLLLEYSSQGDLLWTREYGGGTPDYGLSIGTCSDGGFMVSGCFSDYLYQGLLLRTDSTGSLEGQGIQGPDDTGRYLSVMSNPSLEGTITVDLVREPAPGISVLVIDMTGRTVARTMANSCTVSFHGLPAGVYTVVALGGESVYRVSAAVLGGAE